jgi:hypothetical protein
MTDPEELDEEHEEYGEPEELGDDEEAIPVCPNCLAPFNPLQHYCSDCYEAVGQYTPYIPFVNIRFETRLVRELWKKMVTPTLPILTRVEYFIALMIIALVVAPDQEAIFLGIPFMLWGWSHVEPPRENP